MRSCKRTGPRLLPVGGPITNENVSIDDAGSQWLITRQSSFVVNPRFHPSPGTPVTTPTSKHHCHIRYPHPLMWPEPILLYRCGRFAMNTAAQTHLAQQHPQLPHRTFRGEASPNIQEGRGLAEVSGDGSMSCSMVTG